MRIEDERNSGRTLNLFDDGSNSLIILKETILFYGGLNFFTVLIPAWH